MLRKLRALGTPIGAPLGRQKVTRINTSSSARKFYEEKQSWIRDEKFILDKADQGKSPGEGNI